MIDREAARATLTKHLLDGAEARKLFAQTGVDNVITAAEIIARSMKNGGKLMVCGNGGSAADSQHFAAEFVCRLTSDFERPALPAIALTTDSSFITAYSNDYGFEGLFERQVQALGKPGDVLVGISTSGTSRNVIRAVQACKKQNISTIALCGQKGTLAEICDLAICVPSPKAQLIQEIHLAAEHLICHLVERALVP